MYNTSWTKITKTALVLSALNCGAAAGATASLPRLVRDCLESTETAVLDVPRQHELQERWVAVSRGARRQLTPRRRHAALYSNLIVATATIGLCYAAHSGFMVCWKIYLTSFFFSMKLHLN